MEKEVIVAYRLAGQVLKIRGFLTARNDSYVTLRCGNRVRFIPAEWVVGIRRITPFDRLLDRLRRGKDGE